MTYFLLIEIGAYIPNSDINVTKIVVSDKPRAKHKLKPRHEHLSFDCINCHQNQGDNPSKFKEIGDNGCTICHTNMIGSNKISARAQKICTPTIKNFLAVIKS